MSDFTPRSEDEINAMGLIPAESRCNFQVIDAEIKISSTGKKMIAIQMEVWPPDGGEPKKIRDWLVASDHQLCQRKLRHFAHSVGKPEAYESGSLEAFPGVGAAGVCIVTIEEDAEWGSQNRIGDYVVHQDPRTDKPGPASLPGVPGAQTVAANKQAGSDEQVPF